MVHQDTAALGRMAATILQTVLRRLDPKRELWPTLTQFRREDGAVVPIDNEISWPDRPPMINIPEYAARGASPHSMIMSEGSS
jgi:glucosyl-3-phosphoglycerate synthase